MWTYLIIAVLFLYPNDFITYNVSNESSRIEEKPLIVTDRDSIEGK